MAKIQLVSAFINLSGSPENVVFRGGSEAITFPESLVLAALHGGPENVYDVVAQGYVDRTLEEEHTRLTLAYGDIVRKVFPMVGSTHMMQLADDQLPTQEELDAGAAAQRAATEKVRAARTSTTATKSRTKAPEPPAEPTPEPNAEPALPGLNDLPG